MYVSLEADRVCFNDLSQALFVHRLNTELKLKNHLRELKLQIRCQHLELSLCLVGSLL